MPEIRKVESPNEKSAITAQILHMLPAWFGMPESTAEYVSLSAKLECWAAYDAAQAVGFITLNETSPHTMDIHVMGVHPDYHRHGLGKQLFNAAFAWTQQKGYSFMQVKTLDAQHPDEGYRKTRLFYEALGFRALECFPKLWGEANPCLVMVMSLRNQ